MGIAVDSSNFWEICLNSMPGIVGNYQGVQARMFSWFTYGAMNRIFKHYNFNLNGDFIGIHRFLEPLNNHSR